jgi:cellulose synthase/poly-beta-1,6-N-acetylglucosamine synthase-like glycosyltransferase
MLVSELLLVIGIALILVTLPLIVELLVLTLAALLPRAREVGQETEPGIFPLAVVVPAHNEELLIERCVSALLASAVPGVELVVVAHNCTDATAERAEAAGARVLTLNDAEQIGKGCALSFGFSAVLAGRSQAVLVIDADSVVDAGLIRAVQKKFLAGSRALQCRYEVYNSQSNRRTKLMALAIYAMNVIRPQGRSRLGISAGILGNGFALHRDVLAQVPYSSRSIVEDLEYHLALVRAGFRVEFVDAVAVRGEMPVTARGAQAQRARWEGGRLRMMKQWAPKLTSGVLTGRARQFEPLLDLLAMPIAYEVILLLVAACLPFPWLRLYVLVAFAVLVFHVGAAAVRIPGFGGTMIALLTAPGYVLWKFLIFPKIWRRSRADAAWVRTERESPADSQ